jgi:hypothetical protein
MKKKLAIVVTGALALGGLGAVVSLAAVSPDLTISASVSPTKHGTKKKPKKTKLVVKLATEGKANDPSQPCSATPTPEGCNGTFAATKTVVHLGSELQFNGKAFPTCTNAQVTADDSQCPTKSKVGSGKATGNALNLDEHLNVTAYNGPGGNKLELLLVSTDGPLPIHQALEGVLSADSGKYGKKLTVNIPPSLVSPVSGVFATLRQFDTTINAITGKNNKPYVGIQACKDKKVSVAADYTYNDGSKKSVATTTKCT